MASPTISEKAFRIMAEEPKRGWRDGDLVLELRTLIREAIAFSLRSEEDPTLSSSWG
jgi:hypothetical protein